MMPDKNDGYFRVRYKKLDSPCKLSNGLRCDLKFDIDANNNWVFSLYPEFETLSDQTIVGDEWEALDEGTAIIRKQQPKGQPPNTIVGNNQRDSHPTIYGKNEHINIHKNQ